MEVLINRNPIANPNPGAVYTVADDAPAPPQDVVAFACDLLGVAPPPEVPFDEADLSPMARSFYADSKRVSNRRIREELGVRLEYPDFEAGLQALRDSADNPPRTSNAFWIAMRTPPWPNV